MTAVGPLQAFLALPPGTRVVVRHRITGGATDSLGILLRVSNTECTIDTRTGPVMVAVADIVAAKPIPPPPAPRTRRV